MMTAVDWLVEQMINRNFFARDTELSYTTLDHLQYEAKEMEKQQIIKAVDYCLASVKLSDDKTMFTATTPEQYYNETFNNED